MDKIISQMTKEEKLQALADYHACKRERHIILRYIQALRREDAEQTAYFESFGESVHQIVLNVNTYERRLVFGYVDKQFNKEAVRTGIHRLEGHYTYAERHSLTDKGNYNPKYIRKLKAGLRELKLRYTAPQQLSLF